MRPIALYSQMKSKKKILLRAGLSIEEIFPSSITEETTAFEVGSKTQYPSIAYQNVCRFTANFWQGMIPRERWHLSKNTIIAFNDCITVQYFNIKH